MKAVSTHKLSPALSQKLAGARPDAHLTAVIDLAVSPSVGLPATDPAARFAAARDAFNAIAGPVLAAVRSAGGSQVGVSNWLTGELEVDTTVAGALALARMPQVTKLDLPQALTPDRA